MKEKYGIIKTSKIADGFIKENTTEEKMYARGNEISFNLYRRRCRED